MQNAELTTLPSPKGDTSPCTGEAVEENAKCKIKAGGHGGTDAPKS